jgi:hypothetical protein
MRQEGPNKLKFVTHQNNTWFITACVYYIWPSRGKRRDLPLTRNTTLNPHAQMAITTGTFFLSQIAILKLSMVIEWK